MKKILSLLALLSLVMTINSCRKNELSNSSNDPVVPYDPGTAIITSVAGKVLAQNGSPLNAVEITIGSTTVMTDAGGNFLIPKATLSQNAGFIKASKAGYFAASRTIKPKEKVINNVVIQMVKKTESGSFSNASGGTITVSTGGSIVFPANAIASKAGGAYSGTVKVSAYFLNPTSKDCYKEMPGDLRGINTNNNEQVLTSYGMMAVELQGSNGEALQIATGKTAELSFPIDASIKAYAPATIPLWYFDETKGLWIEQGSATKTGDTYVGTVSHFTWWNCDFGGTRVDLTLKVVDQNGNGIPNATVEITRINAPANVWGGVAHGQTASDGTLTGGVPYNEVLEIKVYGNNNYCPFVSTITNIGPFTQNTNYGNYIVSVATSSLIHVTGTVNDCSNTPVANGYAVYDFNGKKGYAQITNGSLSINEVYCGAAPTGTMSLEVFDLTSLKKNINPININITGSGSFSVGTIQACGVQTAIKYTIILKDQNGNSINGRYIYFIPDSAKISYYGDTVKAILPFNTVLSRVIYVSTPCGYVKADSASIGPFTNNFDAGILNINIPQTNIFIISGNVNNCSNNPVTNGVARITIDGITDTTVIANGSFSQQIIRCNNNTTTATIQVLDYTAYQQNSTPITIQVNNANVSIGTVQACGLNIQEFLNWTFNNGTQTSSTSKYLYQDSIGRTHFGGSSGPNFQADFAGMSLGTFDMNTAIGGFIPPNSYYNYSTDGGANKVNVTVTEYGSVDQYVAGTFNGNLNLNGTSAPISGSFRIKRSR